MNTRTLWVPDYERWSRQLGREPHVSALLSSIASTSPQSAVEIERLDSNTRSPIFFGKEHRFKRLYELSGLESKRNNPRGTSRVDSTKADILPETQPKQVVWQQQEHTFVYNHLTSTGSSVELKNQVKAIGVGLALVEITPLLRLPNGSASTLSENENAPRAPILVTNTLASVKADVAALEKEGIPMSCCDWCNAWTSDVEENVGEGWGDRYQQR